MLDVELKAMLGQIAASGAPDLGDLPPPAARAFYRQILAGGDLPPADVGVAERRIDGPGGELALRIFSPRGAGGARGVVLYLHGGGFSLGDLDAYDSVCRRLTVDSDCIVVAVDYRLAPEFPFPAAVLDCEAALHWLAANAAQIGGDRQRLAVCGDSAGGNLAAVLALIARERGPAIRYQALAYPVTTSTVGELPSHERFGQGYVLSSKAMRNFTALYFDTGEGAQDFRGAPLRASSFAGLPPALVLVGAFDALRDDGVAYAEALAAAGVQVTLLEYHGLSHGFLNMASFLTAGRIALRQLGSALGEVLRAD